jgi:hypothetical protein
MFYLNNLYMNICEGVHMKVKIVFVMINIPLMKKKWVVVGNFLVKNMSSYHEFYQVFILNKLSN